MLANDGTRWEEDGGGRENEGTLAEIRGSRETAV